MAELEMLSVVALVEELPRKGLTRGQVGTVVENLAPRVYEFSDDNGQACASAALRTISCCALSTKPKHHAA